jgi:hypothetical protein
MKKPGTDTKCNECPYFGDTTQCVRVCTVCGKKNTILNKLAKICCRTQENLKYVCGKEKLFD